MNMDFNLVEQDTVYTEWKQNLMAYPPLLTPRQVEDVSLGIVKSGDVYKRRCKEGKRLNLDVRTVGGRVYVTRESLLAVLTGKPELPL